MLKNRSFAFVLSSILALIALLGFYIGEWSQIFFFFKTNPLEPTVKAVMSGFIHICVFLGGFGSYMPAKVDVIGTELLPSFSVHITGEAIPYPKLWLFCGISTCLGGGAMFLSGILGANNVEGAKKWGILGGILMFLPVTVFTYAIFFAQLDTKLEAGPSYWLLLASMLCCLIGFLFTPPKKIAIPKRAKKRRKRRH